MIRKKIIEDMKKTLDEKRFSHVLAVADEVESLCKIYDIADSDTLVMSALLHDCTKPLSYDEHIKYAEKAGLELTADDLNSPEVLHARTGAVKAESEYHIRGSEIFCHTTGKENMTLGEKILFLSDYIETTRQHEICKKTRREFYSSLSKEDKFRLLDRTVLRVLENTVDHLRKKQAFIHSDTLRAIDFLKEDSNETKRNSK